MVAYREASTTISEDLKGARKYLAFVLHAERQTALDNCASANMQIGSFMETCPAKHRASGGAKHECCAALQRADGGIQHGGTDEAAGVVVPLWISC